MKKVLDSYTYICYTDTQKGGQHDRSQENGNKKIR